ncbi:hypothetical protein NDU88_002792 [Pleurodeles waltl]|uniref:Uncharacterized protein n=1 Tax=Pleurodeles waltl TaxID=8319 RepID=A0AAV7SD13_PLEWA|nr:hypothetical protein NDU88_002792 [Pleurodeles waltl]
MKGKPSREQAARETVLMLAEIELHSNKDYASLTTTEDSPYRPLIVKVVDAELELRALLASTPMTSNQII